MYMLYSTSHYSIVYYSNKTYNCEGNDFCTKIKQFKNFEIYLRPFSNNCETRLHQEYCHPDLKS